MPKSTKPKLVASTSLDEVRQQVETGLRNYCAEQTRQAAEMHPSYQHLWQVITSQVMAGGKRLRPYALVLSAEAYGARCTPQLIEVAMAWELLHVGLLMHDDIIDRDLLRHGQPNAIAAYLENYLPISDLNDRLHYAEAAAMLAGDLLLTAAPSLLASSVNSQQLQQIMHDATWQVIGGELLDLENGLLEPINPQLIAQAKTASYSIVGPLKSGALSAGAPASELSMLSDLGLTLGTGFQLADDLLVFDDISSTGKSADSDLIAGKRTSVIVEALSQLPTTDRLRLAALIGSPSVDNVPEIRKLLGETDAQATLLAQLSGYETTALTLINKLAIPDSYRRQFAAFTKTLLYRRH
ncbi:MAG: polyprenyl synthetase family protein [Candidatus Saccharimonadales bacterium]